jgi:putative endonuclease
MRNTSPASRAGRGLRAQASGAALVAEGWSILGQRLRTQAGEVDLVAERDGLLAIIEVKHRPTLSGAAGALSARQRARLLAAGEILLAAHPEWGRAGVRFDVMLVDSDQRVRRIKDAFRLED